MTKQNWKTTEEKITNFEFKQTKTFNLLISDKMFKSLELIGKKKGVKLLIALIISYGVKALPKFKSSINEWKFFQHLIPEDELNQYKMNKRKRKFVTQQDNDNKENDNKTKKRKHYHHFVDLVITRSQYNEILQAHHRTNTFSMAMIIRILVEIFLDLYTKYGDKTKALEKLSETIEKIVSNDGITKTEFILLKEQLEGTDLWRAWGFFQIELYDTKHNQTYFFRLRL